MEEIVINSRFLTQRLTGTQRYGIEIAIHLSRLSKCLQFVAPHNIVHKEVASVLRVKRIGNLTGHLWEQVELPFYLRRKLGSSSLLVGLVNTGPIYYEKQIITIHDLAFLRYPNWFSREFRFFYKVLIPRIANLAKKIVTVSYFSKQEMVSVLGIPQNKIEVVYGGISERFRSDPSIEKEDYILGVASLEPRKNFNGLLMAFKKLIVKRRFRKYKLLIVGSRNKVFSDPKLENLMREVRNVEFVGHISDNELITLYQKAKLFVFPSFYEGFGLPPLEAMSCGTPVIVSNVSSLPEVCGDAAYYVNPWALDDITRAMEEILGDEFLQKELIRRGLERVKLFDWAKSSNKLWNIIKEVQQ